MPQQLIYTSAPQGVDVGRSGYCTVARSSTMGESLVQRLEQFSYYERLSEHGGEAERIVFIFRNIDIRGKAYHVLSRIKDAPADYTGRTNFIAQHLVFTPDEVANMPTPAVLLNHWSGWKDQWEQEPRLFADESWTEFDELKRRTFLPAKHWFTETADYGRAAGLLGLNAGVFTAHDFKPKLILDLLSESLELLQLDGSNWRSLAWQRTFSVGCQPQDNAADFRWRFLTSGLPFESSVNQGRASLELRRLRAPSNSQQVQFAQKGPSPPQFMHLHRTGEAVQINEGETLILDGEALSLPGPSIYRWYRVEKDNVTLQEVDGAHDAKLEIPNPQRGKHRYKVKAWDSITDQYDESPLIVVEVKEKLKVPSLTGRPASTSGPAFPSSQGSKNKNEQKGKIALTINRQKHHTPNSEPKEDDFETTSFLIQYKTGILSLACLSLVVAISYMLLSYSGFWKPCFSGMKGKKDWWHAKIRSNPEHFKNDTRLTPATSELIRVFLNPQSVSKQPVEIVILKITEDLEHYSPTNGVKIVPAELKKAEAASPQLKSIQPERAAADSAPRMPREAASKIYVILASKIWENISSPIEVPLEKLREKEKRAKDAVKAADVPAKQQNPKPYANATSELERAEREIQGYTKENQTWDRLRKRKNQASSIEYPRLWPHFKTTNGSPPLTLCWALLGNTPSETNAVIGEWHTNEWSFMTANWSLKISSTGAVYHATKQSGSIHADISMSENADGANERLRLLLFTPDSSNPFQAIVDDDSLNPSPAFQNFLNSLDLENNPLRIYGNYDNTKNPMDYKVKEIDKQGPWKLGIKSQLTSDTKRAEMLENIRDAFNRVETLWTIVKDSTAKQLLERSFAEAVGSGRAKDAFWKQLNRLCVVAIYQKNDDKKTPQLEEKSGEEAWRKIQDYIDKAGVDGSKYQVELKALANDLKHFKLFWDVVYEDKVPANARTVSYKGQPYNAAQELLSKEILALQKRGSELDPTKLTVVLQLHAWSTNWFTITRLLIAAKP